MNLAVTIGSVGSRLDVRRFARYFGIAEQVILSATNMLASLVVVKAAGVAWFGIYSLAFTVATFIGGLSQVLLHRQMTLEISSHEPQRRRDTYLATLAVQTLSLSCVAIAVFVALQVLPAGTWITDHHPETIAVMIFVIALNLFDLNRQYLYVCDAQAYSLMCTVVQSGVALTGFAVVLLASPASLAVMHVYSALGASLAVGLIVNRRCREALGAAVWHGWRHAGTVVGGYFEHSRFSLVGMIVTWAQNQSMTPFLMWFAGPLVVGWFSLARLLVMPLNVIAQGLSNTTIPVLRRTYQNDGERALSREIRNLIVWNAAASALYFAALGIAHLSGLSQRFVPDYANVSHYLLFWCVMMFLTTFRSWVGQFFVVRMRFRFMLCVNVVAVLTTIGGMALAALVFGSVLFALVAVIAGELVSFAILLVVSRRELAAADDGRTA